MSGCNTILATVADAVSPRSFSRLIHVIFSPTRHFGEAQRSFCAEKTDLADSLGQINQSERWVRDGGPILYSGRYLLIIRVARKNNFVLVQKI